MAVIFWSSNITAFKGNQHFFMNDQQFLNKTITATSAAPPVTSNIVFDHEYDAIYPEQEDHDRSRKRDKDPIIIGGDH